MKTGLSLTYHCHRQNRHDLGIMNLIYTKLQYLLSDSSGGKNIQTLKQHHSSSVLLLSYNLTLSLPTPLPPPPEQCRGMENGRAVAGPHQLLSATSSSPHFPCSILGPSHGPQGNTCARVAEGLSRALCWGSWSCWNWLCQAQGSPPVLPSLPGHLFWAQHGRGQSCQQHVRWSHTTLYISGKFHRKLLT